MASGRCVMCLQCGFSFLRSTIFSSKCALAREAQTHCLLWISVCYLIRTETRCSGSQLCSDVILILTPQPCRIIILVSELGYHPAGIPEGSRMLRSCLVLIFTARKHKAGLRCSFSTSYRNCDLDKSVWVRNVVKIATALSASNHEKECCCFTKAWLSVHSVGKICVVMLRKIPQRPRESNPNRYSPQLEMQVVFLMFMTPRMLCLELNGIWVKVQATELFQGFKLSHTNTPNTVLLRQSEPSLVTANPVSLAQLPSGAYNCVLHRLASFCTPQSAT